MEIVLDHTIVHASDPAQSAAFLSTLLGLEPAKRLGHFTVLRAGPTSLDFIQSEGPISPRHFAFRVTEADFDEIFSRLGARGIRYWADPFHKEPDQINHWDDGRGLYFDDPSGHLYEILTRSYGSGGCAARNPNPLLDCP